MLYESNKDLENVIVASDSIKPDAMTRSPSKIVSQSFDYMRRSSKDAVLLSETLKKQ